MPARAPAGHHPPLTPPPAGPFRRRRGEGGGRSRSPRAMRPANRHRSAHPPGRPAPSRGGEQRSRTANRQLSPAREPLPATLPGDTNPSATLPVTPRRAGAGGRPGGTHRCGGAGGRCRAAPAARACPRALEFGAEKPRARRAAADWPPLAGTSGGGGAAASRERGMGGDPPEPALPGDSRPGDPRSATAGEPATPSPNSQGPPVQESPSGAETTVPVFILKRGSPERGQDRNDSPCDNRSPHPRGRVSPGELLSLL